MDTPKPDQGRNRRKAARKIPRTTVKVECRRGSVGLGKNLATQFLDVSEGGVRILSTESLAPKQEVEVILLGLSYSKPLKRLANVSWSVPLENGQCCMGLEFQKRLLYQDIIQLARP
jgi:hypothetical protein